MAKAVTLTALLSKAAEKFPHQKAVVVSGKYQLLHSDLQMTVDSCATQLKYAGIAHGDVVALSFPDSIEFVILFMAVIRARGVAAPLNAAYTACEFEFYLQDSKSKFLLLPSEGNAAAESAAVNLKLPTATARLGPSWRLEFQPKWNSPALTFRTTAQPVSFYDLEDDVALFLHTSGTTSRPKGVPLTQLNLAASTQHIRDTYELSTSDSTVITLPLFHVHGLIGALLSSLISGGAVVLPAAGRFSATTFWNDMKGEGGTWYTAVPTIHQIHQINAAVVPQNGAIVNEDDIITYCKKKLATFKIPKKVYVTESLPKTATGKIQRRVMAEYFSAALGARMGA